MHIWTWSLGALALGHASYTDLRRRLIRNWLVGATAAGGLAVRGLTHGGPGLLVGLAGMVVGCAWWMVVAWAGLGAGDAKLAMAIGAILGPAAALVGPALGHMLCALGLLPWIAWRRLRHLPWRGASVPMAPWIALGTAVFALLRLS